MTAFTVKWCTNSGEEFYYATDHINFVPGPAKVESSNPKAEPDSLWIAWPHPKEDRFEFTTGTLYVMNENGATVGRYFLPALDAPPA